jgi:hypothetical protein
MRQGVHFQRQAFLEPRLQLRVGRGQAVDHDADGRAAIDLFQAIQDWAEELFVGLRIAHVVDGEDDDGFDPGFADPLRGGEFREVRADIERIAFVEVRQPVGNSTLPQQAPANVKRKSFRAGLMPVEDALAGPPKRGKSACAQTFK